MPFAQLVAVLPAVRQGVYRSAVHEAGDAVDVRFMRGSIGDVFELLACVDLDLHDASPPFCVGYHTAAVAVLVVALPGLPGCFVSDFHLGSRSELVFGGGSMSSGTCTVFRVPLQLLELFVGLDAGVTLLLLVTQDGGGVGADVLVDVAGHGARPVAVDELRVGVHAHRDYDAVEVELDESALLQSPLLVVTNFASELDGCADGLGDLVEMERVDGHLFDVP